MELEIRKFRYTEYVKIALGQINPTIGDFGGNARKIIERADKKLAPAYTKLAPACTRAAIFTRSVKPLSTDCGVQPAKNLRNSGWMLAHAK